MKRPLIIAVVAQKGSQGKTTLAAALAQFCSEKIDVVLAGG
jgi:cellulose biosynthesis protein BcsQ